MAGLRFIDVEIGAFPAPGDPPTEEALYVSTFGDPSTFIDDSLPDVGASLGGSMGMDLIYEDSFGDFQTVSFSGTGSFTAVPEPGSFGLVSLLAAGCIFRRRRRERA